jgi:hypothetical protein
MLRNMLARRRFGVSVTMSIAEAAVSYGQDSALSLVRTFVDRPGGGRVPELRRLPVLYFTGPHGIGKTTLLATLESKLQGNIPYARLDCAKDQHLTTQEMLTRLALDLNRKCGMYGRLAFPRFAAGLIAMKATAGAIPGVAHRDMTTALAQARRIDRIKEVLGDAAADLPFGTRIPGVKIFARLLPGLAIDLLLRFPPVRKVLLGRGTAWYGRGNDDPVDVLVTLNGWAQQPDDNRATIDQLLLAAFLADLRYAFRKARRAARRPLNCVILLDNADTEAGVDFLRQLTQMRDDDADPDPLTVVATTLPGGGDEPLDPTDPDLPPDGEIDPWIGRRRALNRFINDLRAYQTQQGQKCKARPLTIVTGSDAAVFSQGRARPADRSGRPPHAGFTLLYVPLADPNVLKKTNPKPFANLLAEFTQRAPGDAPKTVFPASDLNDGWGIAAHDAMMTAGSAIREADSDSAGKPPSPEDILLTIRQFQAGRQVTGTVTFTNLDRDGNPIPSTTPVVMQIDR